MQAITAQCSDHLSQEYRTSELTIAADNREIPISVFFPAEPGEYPVIAFSHGAFAAPDRYAAMLGPLAASGFVVIAPMHIDSEDMDLTQRPSPAAQWATRNTDMRLALDVPESVRETVNEQDVTALEDQAIAMGHSFGALMAQFAGGAQPIGGGLERENLRASNVAGVIAWSPPGLIPGRLDEQTWASMVVPSLTITGTNDVLPGFIDNWEMHKASFDYAPKGTAQLWVGSGIDHYFGGIFGRLKDEPTADSAALFNRALARSLRFAQRNSGVVKPCTLGPELSGESNKDNSE